MALHRLPSRRAAFLAAFITMTLLAGVVAVITSSVQPGAALADGVRPEEDFVDIRKVQPNVRTPRGENDATRGTFTVDCGRNENGHFNPDNFIAQPGVRNGAQHLHDYVGNLSTNADSTNESLKRAGTTCKNGDKSTYFWPVVRIDRGEQAQNPQGRRGGTGGPQVKSEVVRCPDVASRLEDVPDESQPAVEQRLDQLDGQVEEATERLRGVDKANQEQVQREILQPLSQQRTEALDGLRQVVQASGQQPQLEGLAQCEVQQDNAEIFEPQVKDAQQGADGNNELPGNEGEIQRPEVVDLTFRGSPTGKVRAMPRFLRILYGDAKVSTNGTRNARNSWTCTGFEDRLINKYPICPEGSKVKRVHDFPSCLVGQNIDSQNHRDHIRFPDQNGRCPRGTQAVPQLRISLTYNIPRDIQLQRRYAVDAFPEEDHNPFSDHDDFANVMSQSIMNRVVNCINKNKRCRE